ncbi:expressed protein [Echinococcus multilocularis]|uniref:Expressed protein n=1 Tax=Echinococcus multilocularis TaxID=6211 RepID=A0A068YKI4_ECHMU|nr:expressed protein [Echinococcus multilocularis]
MSAGIWLQKETKKEVDSWATNNIYLQSGFEKRHYRRHRRNTSPALTSCLSVEEVERPMRSAGRTKGEGKEKVSTAKQFVRVV